ncbi:MULTISPECIES: TIGR04454 family lipoprotein [Leptospira]|uniref:TIGR04454 family lipoprotein n=2 Tax=Leptospira TaxID=171 RepID=A0A2M9XAS9_9LEPT|nr:MULTISPECIES: TIGR04454 family lipoprotein [Leptospira]EIE01144.1 hypothetical protein LEP1GSC185_3706 [Leptospira licerasiae serovar Varillal str. VAR 010]EJZ43747.1 putative lipoprotein [Leptospira licerasiae str. MMD4847]PJZ24764.1 TIGR04454 family lipoprotein [Leptospira hartskeerlii]PJZ33144.1 TIGR04454 family lipoprotein [Leptospira hartskeerlii]TGM88864.1 TIGR04454 family lipoprotein [Leptospira licerasiae]
MKNTFFSILTILIFAGLISCGGAKVSQAECDPVVNELISNLAVGQTPEQAEKLKAMQGQISAHLLKECMTGKYDLTCLKSSKTLAALATCKK